VCHFIISFVKYSALLFLLPHELLYNHTEGHTYWKIFRRDSPRVFLKKLDNLSKQKKKKRRCFHSASFNGRRITVEAHKRKEYVFHQMAWQAIWLEEDSMQLLSLFVLICLYFIKGIVKLLFICVWRKSFYMCDINDMNDFNPIMTFVLCKMICKHFILSYLILLF